MKIGGDLAGLGTLGGTLGQAPGKLNDATAALAKRVDTLVSDAGWNGNAADTFKGAWEQDASACAALAKVVRLGADTVSTLATGLTAAQHKLDTAVAAAKAAGLPVTDDGVPAGQYSGTQLTALQTFSAAVKAARADADTARQTADAKLSAIGSAINPDLASDGDATTIPDLAGLGATLKGYYVVPQGQVEKLTDDIAAAKKDYAAKRAQWKSSPAGSDARQSLKTELAGMRAQRSALTSDLADAENLASKFKGGELLDSSVADAAKALGAPLADASKLSRTLDGLPVVDVAATGLATWAQTKTDHEEGWSWTHAAVADGAANTTGLLTGLATDAIPGVGPVLSPVTGYLSGAAVNEVTHNGHWTENIDEHGVLAGTADSLGDTAKATWNNDVVGMAKRVGDDVQHPVSAAESVWNGVKDLF